MSEDRWSSHEHETVGEHTEAEPGSGITAADLAGVLDDATDTAGPPFDTTMVAVGTSVMWGTGNAYENKFVDLVHRDLNGDYPLGEKYLHFNPGSNEEPSKPRYEPPNTDILYPNGSYYDQTLDNGYAGGTHPNGPHLPPSRLRARGGAIIGLSPPATVAVGDTPADAPCGYDDGQREYNDQGGYLAGEADGTYDGKLDGLGQYASLDSEFATLFSRQDINRSKWLLMRDIGWGWPTIADQIEQFNPGGQLFSSPVEVPLADQPDLFDYPLPKRAPSGESVDVVLVDGGTNDMQLGWLNDPLQAGRAEIKEAAKLYFYDNMTGENMPGERGLLQRARDAFPNAVIVLLGYPVWTSNRTDNGRAREFLIANNILGTFVVEQAIDNPLNFSHFQAHYLRKAAAEFARADDGPGIVFAPPGYGVINAMMADWPWAFGVRPNDDPVIGLTQSMSVDDVQSQREAVCEAELVWEMDRLNAEEKSCDAEIGTNVACTAAGVGHPNNEGSRQYADTIVRRYKEYIDRPVGEDADELDGGTDSLRESLERYGIGPDGDRLRQGLSGSTVGTRWALSQRVVDSISLEVETDDTVLGGDLLEGRPWLAVRPGRRGEAGKGDHERFVLDTESRDYVGTDEFYVDPMMRRRLTGPVGNSDEAESGVKTGQNELDEQTVHPQGHWSDRRLRLGMVDHLTMVVENTEANGWAAERVSYQLNGSVGGSRTLSEDFDRNDVRDTLRPREFQVASFNDVDGVRASDLTLNRILTGFDGPLTQPATLDLSVGVENPTDQRIPSVLVQYGWEVNGEGRDWQVVDLGAVPDGGSQSADVQLTARQDPAFRTGTITIRTAVFVGDTVQWTATETNRGDLSEL